MRQTSLLILALLLTAGLALAQEAPKRKSGLWDITRTSTYTEDRPSHMKLCVDAASDNALRQLAEGMRGESCTTDKLSRDGDNLVVEATCKLSASTSRTHAVISGNFDSGYTIQSKSTYKPPLAGKAEGHALLVAKWTGPCPAGQRPGEAIMDNGAKLDSDGIVQSPRVKKSKSDASDKSQPKHGSSLLPPGVTPELLMQGKDHVPPPSRVPANPPVPSQ
jgi:uncharacterized protein DUF3617